MHHYPKWIIGFVSFLLLTNLSARLETTYSDYTKFTDLEQTDRSKETTWKLFDRSILSSKKLQKIAGEKGGLTLSFTDIDLAGQILPSMKTGKELRVIRSSFPPKLSFDYVLTDASGKVIKEGSERLVGIDFEFDLGRKTSSDTFYSEVALIEDWAKKL